LGGGVHANVNSDRRENLNLPRWPGSSIPATVIASEKMAKHFWPGQDPIGKRLKPGSTTSDCPWREVIGVVKDVRQNDFVADPKLQMYMSCCQPHLELRVKLDGFKPSSPEGGLCRKSK
jgi:hypothetical protein